MSSPLAVLKRRAREVGKRLVRAVATATGAFRPFPELVIVGVKRGGTTSLFRDLEQHPGMLPLVPSARILPLASNQKGVHYFDDHFQRSARWYRGHFATAAARHLRRRRAGTAFAAEASPYTIFHPLGAERVAALLPASTVFVVLLRDPVERTISHWSEQTRNGVETLPLREAIQRESDRVGAAAQQLAAGEISHSHAHEQQTFAGQSRYADSLERWFATVGRDRTLVMFSEDYYAEPRSVLDRVTERLGLPPLPAAADSSHANAAPRSAAIDADLEAHLVDYFADDVRRVGELLSITPPWPRWTTGAPPT